MEDWLVTPALTGLGGKRRSCALGLNPYKSAYQLWKEKVSGELEPQESNKFILWGNLLEEPIISAYEYMTNMKVIREKKLRIPSDSYNNIFTNLDGVVEDEEPMVFEAKSTVSHVYKSWKSEDEDGEYAQSIPMTYYCQVQGELSVTGFKSAILAVFF